MFDDRTDAGEQLADIVVSHGIEVDIVLGISRGGIPVGRAISDRLNVPLDVVVARKIRLPGHQEIALGAVAADGTTWLNEPVINELGVSADVVNDVVEREHTVAEEDVNRYRDDGKLSAVEGKTVLIVDDGVATGATATACIRQVKDAGAEHVVLAIPIGPPETIERLLSEADDVISIESPPHFSSIGQFYREFE